MTDGWGQPFRDSPVKRCSGHLCAACLRLSPDRFCTHGSPVSVVGHQRMLDGDKQEMQKRSDFSNEMRASNSRKE